MSLRHPVCIIPRALLLRGCTCLRRDNGSLQSAPTNSHKSALIFSNHVYSIFFLVLTIIWRNPRIFELTHIIRARYEINCFQQLQSRPPPPFQTVTCDKLNGKGCTTLSPRAACFAARPSIRATSPGATSDSAVPLCPARAVLPTLWV